VTKKPIITPELGMSAALTEAKSAISRGEVPVGAVIVIGDEIIATASNRTEELADPTAHAEILAIREACKKQQDWRLEDATIYVTLEPCTMCAAAIRNARIGKVIFGAKDPRMGAGGSLYDILLEPRLGPEPKVLEGIESSECLKLLNDFFKTLRK